MSFIGWVMRKIRAAGVFLRAHWGACVFFFLIGFIIGVPVDPSFFSDLYADFFSPKPPTDEQRLGLQPQHLTNPLLDCESSGRINLQEYQPLKDVAQQAINAELGAHRSDRISMYFRSMNSGDWVGIKDTDAYTAASLTKLSFMMAYFKLAEIEPSILDKQILYAGTFDNSAEQNIKPAQSLKAGQSYAVAELIRRMIVYSGNNSTTLLVNNIDAKYIDQIFNDLSIPRIRDSQQELMISARQFSIFFRVLYNASYLSHDMSERALNLLERADFKNGLVAGVPADVVVAHKFGERGYVGVDGAKQGYELHDCGIVYDGHAPFFLCIMTHGNDLKQQEKSIENITHAVYSFRHKTNSNL